MNNFRLIQEHFGQLHCAYCDSPFSPDGVELLREEDDYWVVRVSCSACSQPAGVAIVGIEYEETFPKSNSQSPAIPSSNQTVTAAPSRPIISDLNLRDRRRFAAKQPISTDEVLDAHKFIQDLGDDWARFLPKRFRPRHYG